MKKITMTFIAILIISLSSTPVLGASVFQGSIEEMENNVPVPLGYDQNSIPDTVEINGVRYMWKSLQSGCHPVKYDPATYDFFMGFDYNYDCIFTGEYYIIRDANSDNSAWINKWHIGYLYIYNTDFELINKAQFDGYVEKIGYSNGIVYCDVYWSGMWQSTDMQNWTKSETDLVFADKVGEIVYHCLKKPDNSGRTEMKLSVNESDFYSVEYESGEKELDETRFIDYTFDSYHDKVEFSNDYVYSVTVAHPINRNLWVRPSCIYEYGDELVIDWYGRGGIQEESYRLRTPKQPIYDELERLKSAPYVCVNDTILGFETPPITENDRTLVPMRFLFEKLGAEVSWDQETETATAQKANTVLSFSIDQNNATVNGQPAAMDVPARLVNDKTMVPLRFLSENLGYTVEWDEATRMATIKE